MESRGWNQSSHRTETVKAHPLGNHLRRNQRHGPTMQIGLLTGRPNVTHVEASPKRTIRTSRSLNLLGAINPPPSQDERIPRFVRLRATLPKPNSGCQHMHRRSYWLLSKSENPFKFICYNVGGADGAD